MATIAPLKEALTVLRAELKQRGFKTKGTKFHRIVDGNTVVIALQKSRDFVPDATKIIFNGGVTSGRLNRRLPGDPLDVWRAHYKQRIKKDGRELWIHVGAHDASSEVAQRILDPVLSLVADLEAHASDEALRDMWLSGYGGGQTEMDMRIFLAILVNEIGPAEALPDVVARARALVKDSMHENLVEHLLRIGGVIS